MGAAALALGGPDDAVDAGGAGRAGLAAGAADPGDRGDADLDEGREELEHGGGLGEAEQEHELARGGGHVAAGEQVDLAAASVAAADAGGPHLAVIVDELELGAVGGATDPAQVVALVGVEDGGLARIEAGGRPRCEHAEAHAGSPARRCRAHHSFRSARACSCRPTAA